MSEQTGMPQVIPIQYVSVQDCDHVKLSINEVLLYAVIHRAQPVPDLSGVSVSFDALAAAYPVLWPYGCGLFHETQPQKLSFPECICWTIQYFDKQFQKHHSFGFVVFSIQQKQSALLSTKIHMQ